MPGRIPFVVPMAAVVGSLASPLSAQYKTHFEVTGGPHAGTYEFGGGYGATPSMCSVTRDSAGSNVIATTSAPLHGQSNRVASVTITFGGPVNADVNTTSFRFAILFNGTDGAQPSSIRFDGMGATQPPEAGTLVITFVGYKAAFSGAATDGAEHVRVTGTIACKAYNKLF